MNKIIKINDRPILWGYIGVSHDVNQRWEQHLENSKKLTGSKIHDELCRNYKMTHVQEELLKDYTDPKPGAYRCVILYLCKDGVTGYQLEKDLIRELKMVDKGLNDSEGTGVPDPNHVYDEHFVYYIYKSEN